MIYIQTAYRHPHPAEPVTNIDTQTKVTQRRRNLLQLERLRLITYAVHSAHSHIECDEREKKTIQSTYVCGCERSRCRSHNSRHWCGGRALRVFFSNAFDTNRVTNSIYGLRAHIFTSVDEIVLSGVLQPQRIGRMKCWNQRATFFQSCTLYRYTSSFCATYSSWAISNFNIIVNIVRIFGLN